MFVERRVVADQLWADVVNGPCPFCYRADRHAHLISTDYGPSVGNLVASPEDLDRAEFLDRLVGR
jgi:hypothetical protein